MSDNYVRLDYGPYKLVYGYRDGKFVGKAFPSTPVISSNLVDLNVTGDSNDDVLLKLKREVLSNIIPLGHSTDTVLGSKHLEYLAFLGKPLTDGRSIRTSRETHCFKCKHAIYPSQTAFECTNCGWIICDNCGACGCGYVL